MLLLGTSACGHTGPESGVESDVDETVWLSVAFDRVAGRIDPTTGALEWLDTPSPVQAFFGDNANRTMRAYTTQGRLDEEAAAGWREISLGDALVGSIDDLVPTGRLVIEESGRIRQISEDDEFVVTAAWSPVDDQVLAYTYGTEGGFGVRVIDVVSGRTLAEQVPHHKWEVLADHLVFYRSDRVAFLTVRSIGMGIEGDPMWSFGTAALNLRGSLVQEGIDELEVDEGGQRIVERRGSQRLTLLQDAERGGTLTLGASSGPHTPADRLVSWSAAGAVSVDVDTDLIRLWLTRVNRPPVVLATMTAVTYKLPWAYPDRATVTQVGVANGGGCNVDSHVGGMSYAIDFQLSAPADYVVAAADGTVAGFNKDATTNCRDRVRCMIYRPDGCGTSESGYGWGNWTILAHADGTWTLYAHFEADTTTAGTVGSPVAAGCILGNEGGTGASEGWKHGCGDHLHFQRMSGSSTSSQSVAVTFSDTTINNTSCGQVYTGTLGGMSCAL